MEVALSPSYWLDLFTGKTWEEFLAAGGEVSGFRESRWNTVRKMNPGDILLCYVTGVSRWIGALEVTGQPFKSDDPIWEDQIFPSRLPVKVLIALPPEHAIPVQLMRDRLSYFQNAESSMAWTGHFRGSPTREKEHDAQEVMKALADAERHPVVREVNKRKWERKPRTFDSPSGPVTIPAEVSEEVPAPEKSLEPVHAEQEVTHEEIQWVLLKLGSEMGFDLWVAKNDRHRQYAGQTFGEFLGMRDSLPAQFDPATNRTIELIDVLWLRGNAIEAAFEVEHSTAIYSGLLRMADLVAMQPNINIRLYIVAPDNRRDKVLTEIARPTFARMKPPLYEHCQFIPYSELKRNEETLRGYLQHMKPEFLDEFSESAQPGC